MTFRKSSLWEHKWYRQEIVAFRPLLSLAPSLTLVPSAILACQCSHDCTLKDTSGMALDTSAGPDGVSTRQPVRELGAYISTKNGSASSSHLQNRGKSGSTFCSHIRGNDSKGKGLFQNKERLWWEVWVAEIVPTPWIMAELSSLAQLERLGSVSKAKRWDCKKYICVCQIYSNLYTYLEEESETLYIELVGCTSSFADCHAHIDGAI